MTEKEIMKLAFNQGYELQKSDPDLAVQSIRVDSGLKNSFHGNISKAGNYIHPNTNEILGNIHDYIF